MKAGSKSISIKRKIFIYLIGFCSMLLILLWLIQVVFLESFYKSIKISEIKKSANTITKNIDSIHLQALVDKISNANDVCAEIIFENGGEIISSDVLRDCIIHRMPPFEKQKLFIKTEKNGGELLEYFGREGFSNPKEMEPPKGMEPLKDMEKKFIDRVSPGMRSKNESIIFSKIMTDSTGQRKILFLNSVISPVDATIKTLRIQLCYVTGFMMLFSSALAIYIAKNISKPIVGINDSAKSMAAGNYDIKFSGSGYKEIRELSDTMNYTVKELSKVDNLRKELIANISHDLRTPLTLISGYAEAMRDLPSENNAENAQVIVDEAKRLTSLVNDVLDISKFQSGTQSLTLTNYNFTESIHLVINRFSELVKKDGYRIEFIYDKEVFIDADELRISQVFYNLLSNAINFTGEDKLVIVRQTADEHRVKIEVIDSGEGISEENLPYIWDRYYNTNKTHKRAVVGTGLGLSIVRSIVSSHGGESGVISALGEGSVFWFSLCI